MANTLGSASVLITGGAGFIGCALSARLAPLVRRLAVIDNLHPQVHRERQRPPALHPDATLLIGDVTDAAIWDGYLSEGGTPDIVVHLAAETGTGQSLLEATRHGMANVVGTTVMLDALTRHGVMPNHILLTSSRAVYGEGAWQRSDGSIFYPGQRTHSQLVDGKWDFHDAKSVPSSAATTVPHPSSVYGATKLAQEHLLVAWCQARDVAASILRLQNVYGPGQSLSNPYTGIVSLFSQLAANGQSIPLYEDGLVTRDFVFIDDVVAAAMAVLGSPPAPPSLFDVGSGVATTILQLAELLAEYHGAPGPTITGEFRDGDVRHASCTLDRTKEALSWCPQWTLQQGVEALQEWIEKEGPSQHPTARSCRPQR